MGPVPGLQVQNRQNYAQDLQLSIRGFGARSTFGVRGVRLYVDGIPATLPDGQGQTSNTTSAPSAASRSCAGLSRRSTAIRPAARCRPSPRRGRGRPRRASRHLPERRPLRALSGIAANDRNNARTPGYAVTSLYAGYVKRWERWDLNAFARVDNLFDWRYVGSVIVDEGNARYFEPALGHNWTVGMGAAYRF